MPTLIQDIRYGSRMLLKNTGFTAIAVLTLALAIGANSALFSVVNAVLLRPLPFHNPKRLVNIRMADKQEANGISTIVSYPDFLDWRTQSHSFSSMSVWDSTDFTLTGQGDPIHFAGIAESANLFSTLGVSPALGRNFLASEDRLGNSSFAVILSYATWQGKFGGDPHILGHALTLNGLSFKIVGVMPEGFQFPIQHDPVELWTTMAPKMLSRNGPPLTEQRGARWLLTVGRLKPGVTIQQATADLNVIQSAINKAHPENRPKGINIIPEKERLVGDVNQALLILFGAVGFVLLIACANLANLLLARSTARQKEISIRAALGAGRAAIIRQLLTESVLLSLIGGACGLLLAFWANSALISLAAKSVPRAASIGLDGTVLAFTAAVTILCGLLFGLAPALQTSKLSISHALNETGRSETGSGDQGRVRSTLVVSEVALALVLLIGSGLLIQSLWKLQRTDPGFRKNQLVTFEVYLPSSRYQQNEQIHAFYRDLIPKLRAVPGVQEASGAFGLPFTPSGITVGFDIARHPLPESERPTADIKIVASDFFQTLGIPLLKGRAFSPEDTQSSMPVIMVNQAFVKKFFRGEDPIGQQVKPGIGFGKENPEELRDVIGVVGDTKGTGDLSEPDDPQMYLPTTQGPVNDMNFVIRTALPLETVLPDLRTQVHSLDHDLPLLGVKTMSDYVDESIAQPKLNTLLLGIFAGLAFILTAIGLYGVISYSVAQRTREMGIRMALGAQRGLILKMILRQGIRLALIGIAAGLCAAFALTRLINSLLYGVRPTDVATFLGVSLLLFAIALLASYVPALRATRIDPVVALRHE